MTKQMQNLLGVSEPIGFPADVRAPLSDRQGLAGLSTASGQSSKMTERKPPTASQETGLSRLLDYQGGFGQLSRSLRKQRKKQRSLRELDWLKAHKSQYAGHWVALDGDQLLASGSDPKSVLAEAKRQGVELPLLVRVPDSELPFGGW